MAGFGFGFCPPDRSDDDVVGTIVASDRANAIMQKIAATGDDPGDHRDMILAIACVDTITQTLRTLVGHDRADEMVEMIWRELESVEIG